MTVRRLKGARRCGHGAARIGLVTCVYDTLCTGWGGTCILTTVYGVNPLAGSELHDDSPIEASTMTLSARWPKGENMNPHHQHQPASYGESRLVSAAEYESAVLAIVCQIPAGRAMTYGLIAEIVAESLHRGGPRQVGQVLARSPVIDDEGNVIPWWRVVNAAGSPPSHHLEEALAALHDERCPLTADGHRVNLRQAVWFPELDERGNAV
ncbi:MGMT family protein [Streptomyces sp. NPDC091280]|uniref:MGMT family protein n=1 Tax=Streptomyces sp. NPDC091280 TaxID=3365984 RepID=UPI0037FB213D